MVTTEQKPQTTEAPHAERTISPEKRMQQEMQRKLAEITILAILIAAYQNKESDQLFKPSEPSRPETADPGTNRAEIFGLINHTFTPNRQARSRRRSTGFTGGSFAYTPNVGPNISGYRDSIFQPQQAAAEPKPEPDFRPAPSLSETPLGPQLPNLAFNDRIRPVGSRPGDDDFAAADRANEMYQRELFDKGWRGGEATPEEAKRAGKTLNFNYNSDRNPDATPLDTEAVKTFNASRAKPITREDHR